MGDKYGKKTKNHFDDCYLLCSQHERNQLEEEESVGLFKPRVAIRPISLCNEIPVPVFKVLSELELPGSEEDQAAVLSTDSSENTVSDVGFPPSSLPLLFSQGKLDDLT